MLYNQCILTDLRWGSDFCINYTGGSAGAACVFTVESISNCDSMIWYAQSTCQRLCLSQVLGLGGKVSRVNRSGDPALQKKGEPLRYSRDAVV